MYEKRLLKVVDPPCRTLVTDEDGYTYCDDFSLDGHTHSRSDSRADYREWQAPCVYLPHSCDEWVIGGPEQIQALIADLQEALSKLGQGASTPPA